MLALWPTALCILFAPYFDNVVILLYYLRRTWSCRPHRRILTWQSSTSDGKTCVTVVCGVNLCVQRFAHAAICTPLRQVVDTNGKAAIFYEKLQCVFVFPDDIVLPSGDGQDTVSLAAVLPSRSSCAGD